VHGGCLGMLAMRRRQGERLRAFRARVQQVTGGEMLRYPKEAGPGPTGKRNQWREGLAKMRGCICAECRALMPERQAVWERRIKEVKRLLSRGAVGKVG
jgi:hypothetical protein